MTAFSIGIVLPKISFYICYIHLKHLNILISGFAFMLCIYFQLSTVKLYIYFNLDSVSEPSGECFLLFAYLQLVQSNNNNRSNTFSSEKVANIY